MKNAISLLQKLPIKQVQDGERRTEASFKKLREWMDFFGVFVFF